MLFLGANCILTSNKKNAMLTLHGESVQTLMKAEVSMMGGVETQAGVCRICIYHM